MPFLILLTLGWVVIMVFPSLATWPPETPSMPELYYASFVVGVGSVALVYSLLRSRLGLGLMAMRDDDAVSETMGVEVFRSKLYSFLIGAFITGAAAGVIYLFQVFIQPYRGLFHRLDRKTGIHRDYWRHWDH